MNPANIQLRDLDLLDELGQLMSIAEELASRIVAFRYERLPAEAISTAKLAILDTVGVTLAGVSEEAAKIVGRVIPTGTTTGPSLIFGTGRRAACLDAALINGTSAHALDFDDCSDTLGGHPTAPILPALLARAEAVDANGRDVLVAYIAGFETQARIARGVNFHHYEKGWHPTATLGIFGAAAACAKLLGLPEERVAIALSISASLASGLKANFGTMTKALHVGQCSRNGLFAVLLAREGLTANPEAFEHKQGFLNVFNGSGTFDATKILDHWADPLDILVPGVSIKQYPCCASTHPALDAMIELSRTHRVPPETVAQVEVWIHGRRLTHTNRPDPPTALEAKFSLQYCVARALMHQKVVLEHFEGDAFRDPEVRRIMQRIQVAPYTDAQFDPSNQFGAEVAVRVESGQTYSAKMQCALGQTSTNPLSQAMMMAKFETCASRVLSPDRITQLYALLQGLENVRSVRDLTALVEVDGTRR
jgi:2-methylcitrate dehydratase PrpD